MLLTNSLARQFGLTLASTNASKRQYSGASACRQPGQVDRDVDFQRTQERAQLEVAFPLRIDESIECAL